jgi:hypothetical protein
MKTIFKILTLVLLGLYFTACAGNSGGGSSNEGTTSPVVRVIDSTPHNYATLMARSSAGLTSNVRLIMVCDFGLSTEANYDMPVTITDGNPNGGLACNNAKNVTITLKNLSANDLIYRISIDGSLFAADLTIAAGQTVSFQRGF